MHKLKLYRFQKWYSIICRRLPPDPYIGWYLYAVKEGLVVIKKNHIIYSNSYPFTAHLIALRLKEKTGLPWVADFRDPWVDDSLRRQESINWQERLKGKQESRVMKKADHIITASKNYATFLKGKYPHTRGKISTIYNGYDWEGCQDNLQKIQDSYLEFVYAGAFYGPQSPIRFLEALGSLLENGSVSIRDIRYTIIGGHGDKSWKKRFQNSLLKDVISDSGFIPNSRVRDKLRKASCLLIHQAPERGDLIVLGKTFEYISTGRPILALVPGQTECLSILRRSGCLFAQADPDSEEEIKDAILCVYKKWSSGELNVVPNWRYISQFQGKNLTNSFAQILNKLY
ncbi:MAG: glycosyltransferase [Thermodesulfobacteriota bacterium]